MAALPLLLLAVLTTPPDTVLAARPGDRLVLSDVDGEVTVVARDRNEVRGFDEDDRRASVGLVRRGERLTLEGRGHGRSLRLEVPVWLPLEVRGRELSVRVRGSRAAVSVRVLEGTVEIEDVSGDLDVHTVDGEIRVRDVEGRIRLRSGDEDIRVRGARGSLSVVATDGDLTLDDVDVQELEASTTDGDVRFSGVFRPGGTYALSTHDGDIVAHVPAGADVDVEVSTFSGSFRPDFPVTLDRVRTGRKTSFTLGAGGARLTLQAFDGDIVVRRPGGG